MITLHHSMSVSVGWGPRAHVSRGDGKNLHSEMYVARIVWAICIFEWAMMLQNGLDSMVAIGPGVEVASAMAHGWNQMLMLPWQSFAGVLHMENSMGPVADPGSDTRVVLVKKIYV